MLTHDKTRHKKVPISKEIKMQAFWSSGIIEKKTMLNIGNKMQFPIWFQLISHNLRPGDGVSKSRWYQCYRQKGQCECRDGVMRTLINSAQGGLKNKIK